jgi:hypothetical protein
MLLFHYHWLLCNNLLSGRVLWVFTCRFYLTIWLTYFCFLFLLTLVHTHTSVQCLLFPCFPARIQDCLSTHSISPRYAFSSFVNSSTHFAYLSTNLCGITLFYPIYDGRSYLPGYKVPRSTSEQFPKSEPWEPRISYSACRVISSCDTQVRVRVVNWTPWNDVTYESGLVVLHIRNLECKWSFSDQLHVPAHLSQ